MTLQDTALDLLVATLLRDYLADDSSIAAGVPSNATVPKVTMDLGKEPDMPSMVIAAKEEGSKGARRVVSVSCMLLTWLKADDDSAATVSGQTDRTDASAWMTKIEQRLRMMKDVDDDGTPIIGFRTWLQSLDASRLAGWRIVKIVHNGLAPPMRNKEKRTIFHACTLDVHVRVVAV